MKKTYIVEKSKTYVEEITFIKYIFPKSIVKVIDHWNRLHKNDGFPNGNVVRESIVYFLNINTGRVMTIEGNSGWSNNSGFIRKQWLKHKGDFLKSKK